MRQVFSAGPLRVKFACKFIKIERDPVWLLSQRGGLDHPRIKRNPAHQRKFHRVIESVERRRGEQGGARSRIEWQVRHFDARIAKNRLTTSMSVLHVENRIVARLLDHLDEIEI